jgi:hypothetical protein
MNVIAAGQSVGASEAPLSNGAIRRVRLTLPYLALSSTSGEGPRRLDETRTMLPLVLTSVTLFGLRDG